MVKQRLRRGEPSPRPDAVVLRGGAITDARLRADAQANHAVYGFFGISVWVPSSEFAEDDLLATKLVKARTVARFLAADLAERGLELWDTGQAPHYDVVHRDAISLDALVQALIDAPRTTLINPYYDAEGGDDG